MKAGKLYETLACPECDTFYCHTELIREEKYHHPEKTLTCLACQCRFINPWYEGLKPDIRKLTVTETRTPGWVDIQLEVDKESELLTVLAGVVEKALGDEPETSPEAHSGP